MQDNLDQNNALNDLQMMGIDPEVPFYDLNLAGSQGVPAPSQLAHSPSPETNAPTFTQPDTTAPSLTPHDLTEPGIDLHKPGAADPQLPDRADYAHPRGLAIQLSLWPDATEQPSSNLPDMQHPDLTQQAHMQGRPGDLDASALSTMHQQANYQQLDDKTYPEVFMDQSGMNTSSSRHMDLLMRGLDEEER
jgi:hypothetical protein